MPWNGRPRWNGKYVKDFGEITEKIFPVLNGQPFVVSIEGTEDLFFMLFSDEEKLKETTLSMMTKLGLSGQLTHNVFKETSFIDEILDMKIRIMCDPVIVDDHHTKWFELLHQDDMYKYIAESN